MAPTPPERTSADHDSTKDPAQSAGGQRAQVELRVPAEGVYATIVRTTAAGLAARLDFTIDEIEDLRIAIGEASALVMPQATPGAQLICRFVLGEGSMTVELETGTAGDADADRDSFAWQVLETLAEDVAAGSSEGRFRTRFTMRSQVAAGTTGADR